MLIDSHCHLDLPEFEGELSGVLERAKLNRISHLVTICTKLEEFSSVLEIAENTEAVFCSVGVHPHNVDSHKSATKERLIDLAEHKSVIGFGETGLDFFYERSSRSAQEDSFRTHIEASRSAGLPVIVHTRDADEKTIKILKEEFQKGPFTGVIHCFSAGASLAEAAIELGLYISISGIITFKSAEVLRQVVKNIPLENLLLETDAPYLAPVPNRGKRNEPAFISYTAKKLAELKSIEVKELEVITSENFFSLFTKASPQFSKCL